MIIYTILRNLGFIAINVAVVLLASTILHNLKNVFGTIIYPLTYLFKLSLFRVFLDYHLDLQNKGRYVCFKCGGHFEYQHQLDRHLIQHSRLANNGGEKYICHFCNFKFLDEDKLMKHCHYENHDWNKKKHTIEIDHSMTITNKVPHKSNNGRKNQKYQVKILNMVLKLMPSKRCTPMEKFRLHLPLHLRIPNRIGQVEFRHSLNPNCVGCL